MPDIVKFPNEFDDDTNLFLVHDRLKVRLLEDYNPGDTSIVIEGDISSFPPTGIITLTDQVAEIDQRAISFNYGSKTTSTFDELELRPNFVDVSKPKRLTSVTMNVYDAHHNILKDAVIEIEKFVGVQGTIDIAPFGETMEGRTNYVRSKKLIPHAWFEVDKRIGVAPVQFCFTDKSIRPSAWEWNFGDGASYISAHAHSLCVLSTPEVSGVTTISSNATNVNDLDGGKLYKTYYNPGKYDVSLTVSNEFGEDEITIPECVIVRAPAPDEATITVSPSRVCIDTLINIEVIDNGENDCDSITEYTWDLSDDLSHFNTDNTTASYSIGGIYDVKLRVDTELGAYRITNVPQVINVVEKRNLWLLLFDSESNDNSVNKNVVTYEFGLISESFKTTNMPTLAVSRDYSFMSGYDEDIYQKNLFRKNNGFAPRGTITSGELGKSVVFWASDESTINLQQFEPFNEIWSASLLSTISHNWGWTYLNTVNDLYILFGQDTVTSNPTLTEQTRHKLHLSNYSLGSANYIMADYSNGSEELMYNPDDYPATYKSATFGSSGYIARNSAGPSSFFKISDFYGFSGTSTDIVRDIVKLQDIPGTSKEECELVSLSNGVYVFNNSGELAMYSPSTNTWSTGGPGVGSSTFKKLQDTSVLEYIYGFNSISTDFQNLSNTLKISSDGDRRAYLSYDYSENAFIKFNEVDLTFTSIGSRPNKNEQFMNINY